MSNSDPYDPTASPGPGASEYRAPNPPGNDPGQQGTTSARVESGTTGSAYTSAGPGAYVPGSGPQSMPPVSFTGPPHPALAALLGCIPGVGAMYNGQFAKGIAHLAIFAVLSSLGKDNGFFGLLSALWVVYMIIEAYQTARARRDGLPLPNPFGLNDIGERIGINRTTWSEFWGHTAPTGTAAGWTAGTAPVPPAATGPAAVPGQQPFPTEPPHYSVDPYGNAWRAPYQQAYDPQAAAYTSPAPPTPYPPGYDQAYAPPATPYAPGYGAGYGPAYVPAPGAYPPAPFSAIPTGAVWLIGLGILALLGSLRGFSFLEGESLGGLFLIALGGFIFARRYWVDRQLFAPGSAAATLAYLRAGKGAGVLIVLGVLTLFQGLHIAYWDSTWPILLIFLGVWILLERVAQNRLAAELLGSQQGMGVPPGPPPPYAAAPERERASFTDDPEKR